MLCSFVQHPRRGSSYYICTVCEIEQRYTGDINSLKRGCPGYSLPKMTDQVWNFGKAVLDYIKNPETVDNETYESRLKTCDTCEYRVNRRCTVCGCFIEEKAKLASQHCPDIRWDGDLPIHRLIPEIVIGIITAPRKEPTIDATIASLRSSGFDNEKIYVIAEPGSPHPRGSKITVVPNNKTLGHFGNYKSALRWLRDNTSGQLILMCEDDVEFDPNAKVNLLYGLRLLDLNNLGYLSLYTPKHNADLIPNPIRGWNESALFGDAWGALAYCLPKAVLYDIENMDGELTDRDFNLWLCKKGLKTYHHIPSLARHTGVTSTLSHQYHVDQEPA